MGYSLRGEEGQWRADFDDYRWAEIVSDWGNIQHWVSNEKERVVLNVKPRRKFLEFRKRHPCNKTVHYRRKAEQTGGCFASSVDMEMPKLQQDAEEGLQCSPLLQSLTTDAFHDQVLTLDHDSGGVGIP